MSARPTRDDAAAYYFTYIDQVPDGDFGDVLTAQGPETLELLRGISETQSRHRYAPEKWTIKQVLSHLNDTERVFAGRALWFARGLPDALPSFNQDIAIASANADDRSWESHIEEFQTVRAATLTLFRGLPDEVWDRRGVASGHPVSVRALAYIIVGHVAHHCRILREQYLPQLPAA